ncbi:sialate O-acetylesterase [Clostridium perfringens]
MALNDKQINFDINRNNLFNLTAKQFDTTGARSFTFRLLKNSIPFDLTGLSVKVGGKKPDKKDVFNDCKIIDAKKGIVELELTTQMQVVAGTLNLELIILKGETRLSTIPFSVEIIQGATCYSKVQSSDEFGALQNSLWKVDGFGIELNNKMDKDTKDIAINQINKNKGKIDQTYLSEELLQQIAGDTPINAVPADNSITTKKLADDSVTNSKLSQDIAKSVREADTLVSYYSIEDPLLSVFGTYISNPEFENNMFKFTTNKEGSANSALYFNSSEMDVIFSDVNGGTFIVLNVTEEYVYSIRLAESFYVKKHKINGDSIQNDMPPVTSNEMFLNGAKIKVKNDGNSIKIYQNDKLQCELPKTAYGELFTNKTRMGFLITKNQTANLNGVLFVDFPNMFNLATKKEFKTLEANINADITSFKNTQEEFNEVKDSLNIKEIWRTLTLKDYEKKDCIVNLDENGGITINPNPVEKYDWFYTKSTILSYEAVYSGIDTWAVLKQNGDSVIAISLGSRALRTFSKDKNIEYGFANVINKNFAPITGEKIKLYEAEKNIFYCDVYKKNIGEYKNFLKVDVSNVKNIESYKTGYGMVVYKGIVGELAYRSTLGKVKTYVGNPEDNSKTVDLVMFMGQSNMAGRGVASESPIVPTGHGYEFRAMSDPTKLYDIKEPFGVNENNEESGVNETEKTGSMVSSFVKAYYESTQTPIVAVSCSKGGTTIDWWRPNGLPLNDAITRHNKAKKWLLDNGYTIRHDFMVWCQGCSDGDGKLPSETYKQRFKALVEEMMKHGIEKCFIVRIGNNRDNPTLYDDIISAQTELGRTYKNCVLVSTKFDSMATDGLMKDQFHYKQAGYNITGEDAGINTAFYIKNLKEPTMWDWEHQNLYFSHKN